MSCDQWAVDRTLQTKWKESPLTDPVRFRPPGQGHCSTKSALSLSNTPRGLLHGPCSPQQHQATKSTSSVCSHLKKVNNVHHAQTLNCGKCLNDLTGLHLAITLFPTFQLCLISNLKNHIECLDFKITSSFCATSAFYRFIHFNGSLLLFAFKLYFLKTSAITNALSKSCKTVGPSHWNPSPKFHLSFGFTGHLCCET